MPPLFPVTLALYAVALSLYLAHLMAGTQSLARAARIALLAAFGAQAIDIGWLCTHGLHPAVSAREAMSFAAWLICGAYLALSFRFRVPVVGALVVPVTMVLDLAARLSPQHEPSHGVSTLGLTHITLATAGVALFAVAAGAAVVYLVEERNLKAHRAQKMFKRGGASLETLDRLNRRCIVFGFPLFTVALITGAVWGVQLHDQLFTPQYSIAAAAWLMYAVLIVARVTAGWRGRRAAIMTLGGFATSLTVLLIYYVRGFGGTAG
ncbi:MAG: cytochrome c assembly protein [Myxococcales bacterium]|nr:cytochrome c assembly protein [Myxococcales bacterium]